MREMLGQPAGWYRDTERPNVHRYWTGDQWSERVGEELTVLDATRLPEQSRGEHRLDEHAWS